MYTNNCCVSCLFVTITISVSRLMGFWTRHRQVSHVTSPNLTQQSSKLGQQPHHMNTHFVSRHNLFSQLHVASNVWQWPNPSFIRSICFFFFKFCWSEKGRQRQKSIKGNPFRDLWEKPGVSCNGEMFSGFYSLGHVCYRAANRWWFVKSLWNLS